MPSPFLIVPDDALPKTKTHPVRVASADLATARDLVTKAREGRDALDTSHGERASVYKRETAEAVARIARGEAVTVPARPSEAALTDEIDVADRVLAEAEKNQSTAVLAYDAAVRDSLADLLPGLVSRMHAEAVEAATAVEAARAALTRALSSRAVAHGLRSSEAFAALQAAGVQDGTRTVPDEEMNANPLAYGTSYVRHVPNSVRDQADEAARAAFALAPPISETASHLDALRDALALIGDENPADAWTADRCPREVAKALGLSVAPPPAPAPLETREEFDTRVRRAVMNRQQPPSLPEHLGGYA